MITKLLFSVATLTLLSSCDCDSSRPSAHQPGFHEQTATVAWLEVQDAMMSQFLPSETKDKTPTEIMISARELIQSSRISDITEDLVELTRDDLITSVIGLDLPENQVTYYYRLYREAKNAVLDLRSQGLGDNHPKIVTLREKHQNHLENAKLETERLIARLKFENSAKQHQISNLRSLLNSSTDDTATFQQLQAQAFEITTRYQSALTTLDQIKRENLP